MLEWDGPMPPRALAIEVALGLQLSLSPDQALHLPMKLKKRVLGLWKRSKSKDDSEPECVGTVTTSRCVFRRSDLGYED